MSKKVIRQQERKSMRERSKMTEMYYTTVLDMHGTAQLALGLKPSRAMHWTEITNRIQLLREQRERSLGGRFEKLKNKFSRRAGKNNGRNEGKGDLEADCGGDNGGAWTSTDTDKQESAA